MNLVLDLGNTYQKYAVFDGKTIVYQSKQKKIALHEIESLKNDYNISAVLLSSVAGAHIELESALGKMGKCFILTHQTPIPIQNNYQTPETLGNDRLASAVGAHAHFPDTNVLIIDAGTCIKYDFISDANIYLGGAISPGLKLRLSAMHNFTARLPLIHPLQIEEVENIALIGQTTESALLSGAYNGALYEVGGLIDAYHEKYSQLKVIITGGDAQYFEMHLKRQIFALPNLVLEGLNTILNFNLNYN